MEDVLQNEINVDIKLCNDESETGSDGRGNTFILIIIIRKWILDVNYNDDAIARKWWKMDYYMKVDNSSIDDNNDAGIMTLRKEDWDSGGIEGSDARLESEAENEMKMKM